MSKTKRFKIFLLIYGNFVYVGKTFSKKCLRYTDGTAAEKLLR